MTRRINVCLLLTVLLLTVSPAEAQQTAKIPRIGFVTGSGDANNPGPSVEAFRQRLRELGYVEGKNILVEYRYIERKTGAGLRHCG
jgi:Fe2+ transport system protein FeoA